MSWNEKNIQLVAKEDNNYVVPAHAYKLEINIYHYIWAVIINAEIVFSLYMSYVELQLFKCDLSLHISSYSICFGIYQKYIILFFHVK